MVKMDDASQLPIAFKSIDQERLACKSKGKCFARHICRIACMIITVCGIVFFMKHFSPLDGIFEQEAHNPLRYYPGKSKQADRLSIPTSIPTSLPKPPQPPHLPDHLPHHPPHLPHGPPIPEPIECLDISDASATVNLSLTLNHPWSAIHLDHTLDQATIQIQHEESSGPGKEHPPPPPDHDHPHGPPPPDHDHPHGPPPPPHRPHHGHSGGKSETVMVTVSRTAEKARQTPLVTADSFDDQKKEEKDKKVYVCALKLPFAGTGLGLFHHKPPHKKHDGQPEVPNPPSPSTDEEDEKEEPKHSHGPNGSSFPAVSLAFRFPAGAPFDIKFGLPIGPRPPFGKHHHKGLPWWHHHDNHDHKKSSRKGFLVVVTKMVHRVGCAGRKMIAKGE